MIRIKPHMTRVLVALLCLFALQTTVAVAQSPADKVSAFRAQNREGKVAPDATLTRLAREQADAMAAKDILDHGAAGDFNQRIAPTGAGNAAENIAYGNTTFDKTLDQWIRSPGHRKNLLLRNATRLGVASARSERTGRTYWAMVIAGGYEPRRAPKAKSKAKEPTDRLRATSGDKPKQAPKQTPKATATKKNCTFSLLGLCL